MRHFDSALRSLSIQNRMVMWIAPLFLGSSLFLASGVKAESAPAPWKLLDPEARIPDVAPGYSGIVFFKSQEESYPAGTPDRERTASVFVDGAYHASLPKASWAYAEVCPGVHFLNVAQDKSILAIGEGQPTGQQYELAAATTSYFKLRDDDQGIPRLEAIEGTAARAAIEQLPQAVHTISRLQAKACEQPVEPRVLAQPVQAPAVTTNFTLRSSTFFDFDDARLSPRRGRGQAELDEIVQKIRGSYRVVQHIDVVGYADPSGSAAYNLTLSRKRAETISSYLVQAGFASTTLTAKGMGATNLVVPDCAAYLKTTPQIHACNEPNRRVELVVQGLPKN